MRKKIDIIDRDIVRLLVKRFSLVRLIGKCKLAQGLPIGNKAREKAIIKKTASLARGQKLDPEFVKRIYALIFRQAKAEQLKLYKSKKYG